MLEILRGRSSGPCCRFLATLYLVLFAVAGATSASAVDTGPSNADNETATRQVRARFAVHKDFDRLVFRLPSAATAVLHQDGALLTLHFTGSGRLTGNAVSGRRILSMSYTRSEAALRLAPNTRVRNWRGSDMLVIDAFDPIIAGTEPSLSNAGVSIKPDIAAAAGRGTNPMRATVATPTPSTLTSARPAPLETDVAAHGAVTAVPLATANAPSPHIPAMSGSAPTEVEPKIGGTTQAATSHPVSIMVLRDTTAADPTLLVPFGREVGAAAFTRGGEAVVVFDLPNHST